MRLKYLLLFIPLVVISFLNRDLLFSTPNPSWGDMVAIPPQPLPFFESLFHVWRDIFTGGFGPTNIPHLVLSQFSNVIPTSILQGIYLFFLFLLLFISFIDILKHLSIKKSYTDITVLLEANVLVLIVYFSNTFLVNFIQGNPDIYYGYLLGIPVILYLYLFIKDKDIVSGLKMVILITLANLFGSFSIFYLGILLLPFFIIFALVYRKYISYKLLFFLLLLLLVNNAFLLFATAKPIFDAVNALGGAVGKEIVDTSFSLYKGMNPLQLLFFAGNFGDVTWLLFNIPGGFLFKTSLFYPLTALQFVIVCYLLFKANYLSDKINNKLLILGVMGIFLLFFTLLLIWDTSFFGSLTKNFPMIALYRNPKKLVLSLYVAYLVIIFLIKPFVKPNAYRYALIGILLLTVIPNFNIMNDGYNGLKNANKVSSEFYHVKNTISRENFNRLISYPERFVELKQFLQKQDGNDKYYRIIILPDNSQTLYQGQLFYLLNPFYININAAVYGQLKDPVTIMTVLYSSLLNNDSATSQQLLKIANVKYLIVDRNSPFNLYGNESKPLIRTYYGTFTSGNPEEFKKIIDKEKFFKLIKINKDFYIYQNINYKSTLVDTPQHICSLNMFGKPKSTCDFYESSEVAKTVLSKNNISHVSRNSPTDYTFILHAESSGTAVLFFNQTFDKFWSLHSTNTDKLMVSEHRIGNFYGNTWTLHIPSKGDYYLRVTYKLQSIYYILVFVSLISILSTISLILFLSIKKNKK